MNGTLIGNTLRGLIYTLRPGNLFYILLTAALIVVAGTLYLGDLTAHLLTRAETDTFTWIPPTPRVWGILAVIFLLFVAKTLDNAARIYAGHKNASFLPLSEATAGDLFHYLIGLFFFAILLGAAPFICHNLGIGKNIAPYLNGTCALTACLLLPALPLSYLDERNAINMLEVPSLAAAIGSIGIVRYLVLLTLLTLAVVGIGYAVQQLWLQHLAGAMTSIMNNMATHQYDYSKIPFIHYQNAAIIAGLISWLLLYIGSAAAWTYPRDDDDDDYPATAPSPTPNVAENPATTPAQDETPAAGQEGQPDGELAELPARLRQKIAAARATHKQEPQLTKADAPPQLLRGTTLNEEAATDNAAGKQEPQLTHPDDPPRLLRNQKNTVIPAPVIDKNEPHIIPPELELLKDADTTRMSMTEQQTFARTLMQSDDHLRNGEIDEGLALLKPYTDIGHDPAVYFPAYQRCYALQPQDTLLHRPIAAAARGSENCYELIQPELKHIDPAELPADTILPLAQQATKHQQYHTVLALTRNFAKNHPEHPHLTDNYYLAALALAHSGEADKALPILQQLLARYPDHPHIEHIRRTLAELQSGGQT